VGCGSTRNRSPTVGETRIGWPHQIDNLVHVGHGVITGRRLCTPGGPRWRSPVGAVLGNGLLILAGQVALANRCRDLPSGHCLLQIRESMCC